MAATTEIALVAIGRNEGERLERCLRSALAQNILVVYVDSGSTDGSKEFATSLGVEVVELCMQTKFTAARARNAGFKRCIETAPATRYVQFVDGDCELEEDWIGKARDLLDVRDDVCAVFGRRRERYPERSIYNWLCDMEWAVPPGDQDYCGGDVMIRTDALSEVQGYNSSLIAGEEPELCIRLRRRGFKVHTLDAPMTVHDANITKYSQWWRRIRRSGYAYANGAWLHGLAEERHFLWPTIRSLVWGLGIPMAVLALCLVWGLLGLWLMTLYPLQVLRLYLTDQGTPRERFLRSLFNVVNRVPEALGTLEFARDLVLRRDGQIIEYH